MLMTDKTVVITCKGAVEHVKEILQWVEKRLGEDIDDDKIDEAIKDSIEEYVVNTDVPELMTLLGDYDLSDAYNDYVKRHGAYGGNNLIIALCCDVLYNQLDKFMEFYFYYHTNGVKNSWSKLFLTEGEFVVVSE